MNRFLFLMSGCILLLLSGSCDTSFNPSAPFQPRMVVYSILTTDSDTQYVRVYTSYDAPDNDPTKNPDESFVADAQVSITQEEGPTFSFRPVTLQRLDTNRYSSGIKAYYAYPFRAENGKTYTLTVSSPTLGIVSSQTTVPGRGTVIPVNPVALGNPCSSSFDFGVRAALSPQAKAFLLRIYVDYLYPAVDGTYQPKRIQMPLRRSTISAYRGLYEEFYPRPMRRSTPPVSPVTRNDRLYMPTEAVPYNSATFCQLVNYLYQQEGCVHFTQAVFYLIQFDAPLWNYYGTSNLFQDRFSVRIDQPDYTNINTGVGVFGSMTVDSTLYPLPRIIGYNVPPYTAGCQ